MGQAMNLRLLAVTFHGAAQQMREIEPLKIYDASGQLIPEAPSAAMARQIGADVLQVIGNVYHGLADHEAITANKSDAMQ